MIERHLREARSAAGEVPVRSAGERPLRLVVADDQDLVRSGFRLILSSYDGFSIVGRRATARRPWSSLAASCPTWSSWTSACRT